MKLELLAHVLQWGRVTRGFRLRPSGLALELSLAPVLPARLHRGGDHWPQPNKCSPGPQRASPAVVGVDY